MTVVASSAIPVVGLARKNPSHPTPGIWLVSGIARNQMNVKMWDRLTSGRAVIDSDVVAVRSEFHLDCGLGSVKKGKQIDAFFDAQVKQRTDVALRNDECVPGRNREAIPNDYAVLACIDHPLRRQRTERAGLLCVHHDCFVDWPNVTSTRQIQAFGRGTNLHSLWDSGMIRNWPSGLDELMAAIKAVPVVAVDSIATQAWARRAVEAGAPAASIRKVTPCRRATRLSGRPRSLLSWPQPVDASPCCWSRR